MLKFAGVNEEVEELRKQIRINNKNKQLMTNRIKKSQDETGYNLGSFDEITNHKYSAGYAEYSRKAPGST